MTPLLGDAFLTSAINAGPLAPVSADRNPRVGGRSAQAAIRSAMRVRERRAAISSCFVARILSRIVPVASIFWVSGTPSFRKEGEKEENHWAFVCPALWV